MQHLSGQTALITGASAPLGIGRATAHALAKAGAHVFVTDREGEIGGQSCASLLEGLVQDIIDAGGRATAAELDVTKSDQITAVLADIQRDQGRLDILVNNAASMAGVGSFLDSRPEDWHASFEVNLRGPVMLCQAAIPMMQNAGHGRIINISSISGMGGVAGRATYSTMKHALIGLTRSIAAEFGPDGILCNAICPGYIATDLHNQANERLANQAGVSLEEIKKRRYAEVALRDAGQPDNIAQTVAFLAGPGAAYITGTVVPVTGGVPYGI